MKESYIHEFSIRISTLIETLYHKLESTCSFNDLQLFVIQNHNFNFNTFGHEITKDFQYILDLLKEEHDEVLYD